MLDILLLFFELTFYKVEAPDLLQKDRSTTSEKTMPDISNAVPTTTLRDYEFAYCIILDSHKMDPGVVSSRGISIVYCNGLL